MNKTLINIIIDVKPIRIAVVLKRDVRGKAIRVLNKDISANGINTSFVNEDKPITGISL